MQNSLKNNKDISIVICSEAGQGIQTIETLLTRIFKLSGFYVFAAKEYMSRIRGGNNSTQIRISSKRICSPIDRIDILIPLNTDSIKHLQKRITCDTIIIGERNFTQNTDLQCETVIEVEFTKIAADIKNKIYANTVAAGTLAGLFQIEKKLTEEHIKLFFAGKANEIIDNNIKAFIKGYEIGEELFISGKITPNIPANSELNNEMILNGSEAVGLGAIAGGCDFIASYPMSPGTGVLIFLAKYAKEFGIIFDQAEDEISAINMTIGAWYAGARGIVTTSGGGFALMTEGVSLAGMIEMPVVIHIAQRPGPATGLPTRTEQADLELALYSGHGEFPRIIFAPGNIEQCFELSQKAFNLADKFQIPVFILTDEFLVDSYYTLPQFDLTDCPIEKFLVKTTENYKRYEITDTGISPRGIPGYGDGLVIVDSDEHDIEGHLTENLDIRIEMVNKRLRKLNEIKKNIISPEFIGNKNYKILVISWGSTYSIIKEALSILQDDRIAYLHFKQVYPLPADIEKLLNKAEKTVIFENNATSQFAKLIKLHTGIEIKNKILKYNGISFSVEEIVDNLRRI